METIEFPGNKTVKEVEPDNIPEIFTFPPISPSIKDTVEASTDFEIEFEFEEKYVMIQAVIMSRQGPAQITQILKGIKTLDENDIKQKIETKKSSIITLDGQNQKNDIESLMEILIDDYGYSVVKMDATFQFMPTQN